jgi:hypothetical protein
VVSRDEGASPCGVGEVTGELAPGMGRGDHVASAIKVHDRRLAVPGAWHSPKTSHSGGVLETYALGLRGHVLGVLARLPLVLEIHIHGLRALRSNSLKHQALGIYQQVALRMPMTFLPPRS